MNRVAHIIHLDYARRQQLTGKGIGIAIFDTGVAWHPDLKLSGESAGLVDFIDTLHGRKHYYDDNGHGTHITGILAGNGSSNGRMLNGIAPDCHYVMIKVLNERGEGNTENVLAGIDWLIKNYKKYNIRIVNISVGSTRGKHFGEDSPLVQGVNSLWSEGLNVFTAAGNHGPDPYTIGAPGNSRKIVTVGSSDITKYQRERDYSGRGPTESCIKKPDIVAPGTNIVSCYPMTPPSGQRMVAIASSEMPEYYNGAAYLARTGTSMATPIVSGCVALLLQKYPSLTNKEVKLRLRNTALSLGFPHARQGWGLIQCNRLLR